MTEPNPFRPPGSDDAFWRRPDAVAPPVSGVPAAAPAVSSGQYAGPPQATPAPASWRPPTLIQVPPAHELPTQDDAALDEQDRGTRTITLGVGMMTGAIALIVLIILCGRVLF